MQVPSGRTFDQFDLSLLRDFARVGFIQYNEKPFTLRSKILSHVYVYGRDDLTHNPDVLAKTGHRILGVARAHTARMDDLRRPHFLGLPTAGTALATAAALADDLHPPHRAGFSIVREVQKTTHGATEHRGGWVVGKYDPKKWRYFPLDNVTTDGGTKETWAPRLQEDGFPSYDLDWMILVDRQQGALKRLSALGFKSVIVVYNLLDITYAFEKMELWPKVAVKQVEKEIADHQVV